MDDFEYDTLADFVNRYIEDHTVTIHDYGNFVAAAVAAWFHMTDIDYNKFVRQMEKNRNHEKTTFSKRKRRDHN